MTRDILDKHGNVIGALTLPDETTEDVWAEKLGIYSYVAPPKTMAQIVDAKILASIAFGFQVIKEAAAENVMAGITQAGKTREVSDYLAALERYLRSGSLYAAIQEIDDLKADTQRPSDVAEFVTNDRLQNTRNKISTYLG